MVKVATLKDQARQYERQGDFDKALAIYRHILTHLEGTPAIKGQLPLYVKVGDLQFKAGDTEGAVRMYERAAALYAEHGSAKSVIALCLKTLRISPTRTSVYFTFSQQLLDHGHVGAAREVLADFADRANLPKPLETLELVRGRSDDEVRPVLEQMLSRVRRPQDGGSAATSVEEDAPPERAASREAPPPPVSRPEPHEQAFAEPRPESPSSQASMPQDATIVPDEVARPSAEDVSWMRPSVDEPVAAPDRALPEEPQPPPEPDPVATPVHADLVAEPPPEPPRASSVRLEHERRPFSSMTRESERRHGGSRFWMFAAIALIVAALGGAFVKLGVIPVSLFGGSAGPPASPDNTPSTGAGTAPVSAVADSAEGELADSLPDALRGADAVQPDSPGVGSGGAGFDSTFVPGLPDSVVRALVRQNAARADTAPRDSVAGLRPPDVVTPPPLTAPAGLPPGTALAGPAILVRGLVVDSISEFTSGDATGVRVIHFLDSGERLTLRAVPMSGAMADSSIVGAPRVTTLRGDTAFGTVVFGGYMVNARARMDAAELDQLLRRLVRVDAGGRR